MALIQCSAAHPRRERPAAITATAPRPPSHLRDTAVTVCDPLPAPRPPPPPSGIGWSMLGSAVPSSSLQYPGRSALLEPSLQLETPPRLLIPSPTGPCLSSAFTLFPGPFWSPGPAAANSSTRRWSAHPAAWKQARESLLRFLLSARLLVSHSQPRAAPGTFLRAP